LPWQVAPWKDKSPVLLLTGSAGGGKSRLAAEKLHGFCLKYPGAFGLLVRKTRASMTKGSILFLKETVIGSDPGVNHIESKDYFQYRNGSILAYMGLEDGKQRERLKSIGPKGGVDFVWGEEPNELEEADHNALIARMRGKAANWHQIVYTCNPDAPTHWIYRRLIVGGEAKIYYSKAADNPHNPADYVQTLNTLTGVEALRLAGGQWVQATGLVYGDVWADPGNVTEDAEYAPDVGTLLWGVDDGYSGTMDRVTGLYPSDAHPRVILFAQIKTDGHLDIFDELYETQTLPEDQIARALAKPYPEPDGAICDSSAATLRRRLHDNSIPTKRGTHAVVEGIKHLRSYLAADNNGVRRIRVHPRCKHLRSEMASYRIEPGSDTPVKAFDHGLDALRYLAWSQRHEDTNE
jgi:hypothetical protein